MSGGQARRLINTDLEVSRSGMVFFVRCVAQRLRQRGTNGIGRFCPRAEVLCYSRGRLLALTGVGVDFTVAMAGIPNRQ